MRRAAVVVGVVLAVIGALLLLQGFHILPGMVLRGPSSLGWGAWGLMFGAILIVWGNATPKPKAEP